MCLSVSLERVVLVGAKHRGEVVQMPSQDRRSVGTLKFSTLSSRSFRTTLCFR